MQWDLSIQTGEDDTDYITNTLQLLLLITRRGYPDVSLLGHNYRVVMARQWSTVDGTSASTPVMAAFVSLVNSQRVEAGKSKMGW